MSTKSKENFSEFKKTSKGGKFILSKRKMKELSLTQDRLKQRKETLLRLTKANQKIYTGINEILNEEAFCKELEFQFENFFESTYLFTIELSNILESNLKQNASLEKELKSLANQCEEGESRKDYERFVLK